MYSSSYIIKAIDQFSPVASKIAAGFDHMTRKSDKLSRSVSRLKNNFSGIKNYFIAIGTSRAISSSFDTLVKFSEQMQGVKAVATETGISFAKLEEQAKELGRTTRYTASDAAAAQYFLAKAGYDTQEIYKSMPDTLNLAAAGNLDIAQSADIVTNIMAGYGIQSNELAGAVDVLTKSFTSANTDLIELGVAMRYTGPIARKAGLDFAETTAILGKLADAGYKGSLGGTSLRQAISKLSNPSKRAQKYMKYYGLQLRKSNGEVKSFIDIVKELEKSNLNTAGYMALFGERAGPGMAALVGQGSKALEELNEKLKNSQGAAKRTAEIQMEGLYGTWIKLKSAADGLVLALGESGLETVLIKVGEAAIWLLNDLSGFFKDIGTAIEAIQALTNKIIGRDIFEVPDKIQNLFDKVEKGGAITATLNDNMNNNKMTSDNLMQSSNLFQPTINPIKNEIELKLDINDKNNIVGNIQATNRGSAGLNLDLGKSSRGM